MDDRIRKTVEFLDTKLKQSKHFVENPHGREYRFEHSIRAANIGRIIAEKEGLKVLNLTLGCLLHDVAYCMSAEEINGWGNHGRYSAKIARPFLLDLGLTPPEVEEICYGIAIHADGKADFEGEKTPLALSINDADNIDRFDAYRIYDGLRRIQYDKISLEEKREHVEATLQKLSECRNNPTGTLTAYAMWTEKIDYQIDFYNKLLTQINMSVIK